MLLKPLLCSSSQCPGGCLSQNKVESTSVSLSFHKPLWPGTIRPPTQTITHLQIMKNKLWKTQQRHLKSKPPALLGHALLLTKENKNTRRLPSRFTEGNICSDHVWSSEGLINFLRTAVSPYCFSEDVVESGQGSIYLLTCLSNIKEYENTRGSQKEIPTRPTTEPACMSTMGNPIQGLLLKNVSGNARRDHQNQNLLWISK